LLAGYETASIERLPRVDAPNILTAELNRMISAKEEFVLIDIRIASQATQWVEHSQRRLIALDDLPDMYTELPRDQKIVFMDLNGRRSPIAARYLLSKGFTDVARVNGGMRQWVVDGFPVAGGE
jgi:rhodanese-related sulfurtransferase